MGAKGSVEAAKMNSDSWGQHIEVCYCIIKLSMSPFPYLMYEWYERVSILSQSQLHDYKY